MASMTVYQFAHELSFVWAFFYYLAVIFKKMIDEKLIKFL